MDSEVAVLRNDILVFGVCIQVGLQAPAQGLPAAPSPGEGGLRGRPWGTARLQGAPQLEHGAVHDVGVEAASLREGGAGAFRGQLTTDELL